MANSDSVDIYRLRYTQADIMAVPEAERMFYLLATGLANDLQVLVRQFHIAVSQREDDEVKRHGSSVVAMLNLRLLVGRFHEGWKLIYERWGKLEASYDIDMPSKGKEALAELRTHFNVGTKQNIVYLIRNKIGFHSDYGYAKKMLDAVPSDTAMVEYIGQRIGDTLYYGSEVIHNQALQSITGTHNEIEAFLRVMDEVRRLQNLFLVFINSMVKVFATRHLATQFAKINSEKHSLKDLPNFDILQVPYFVDLSGSLERLKANKEVGE